MLGRAKARFKAVEADAAAWRDEALLHERLPVMLAYVGKDERCAYHNEAFRRTLGLAADQIDGRALRTVLGESRYASLAGPLREALGGRKVHEVAGGAYVHLLPDFNGRGEVAGLYVLFVDDAPQPLDSRTPLELADPGEGLDPLYADAPERLLERRAAAARLRAAIKAGQFRLYTQSIMRLATGEASLQGICVRQAEEEQTRLPPGMYLSLTQEFGLQGELDRWVISKLLEHEAAQRGGASVYCVSLSPDSIGDPQFPAYVKAELERTGVAARALCFEIHESDARALRADTLALVGELRGFRARVMLGGFGRENCLEVLKGMKVDFLKIDGSIIFHVGRSDWALGRVRAIVRVAQGVGISTVAELVESEDIAARLRELEVDYAQGMAVSAATPLGEFELQQRNES